MIIIIIIIIIITIIIIIIIIMIKLNLNLTYLPIVYVKSDKTDRRQSKFVVVFDKVDNINVLR